MAGERGGDKPSRVGRSPLQLFGDYLGEQNIEDPRIPRMFGELLDELTGADSSGLAPDDRLRQTRKDAAERRADLAAADQGRASLAGEERKARAQLHKSRDSVVSLGAPPVEDAGLAAAWQTLTTWARAQHADRTQRQRELDGNAAALQQRVRGDTEAITGLLAEHDITDVADLARAAAAVAVQTVRSENELKAVRQARKKAAKLDDQIRKRNEEEQVATMLGQLLRAGSFERWLCSEALDSLVEGASVTLMELSGGQYQLDRDDRNDLVVIDYEDAGARRPVHTLSGGETFQASLALALALSRQVVGLSAGMRDLNSRCVRRRDGAGRPFSCRGSVVSVSVPGPVRSSPARPP